MNGEIALTFAIPAYKRARSVESLLAQLQAQAGPQDEILVYDDGCDDEVALVVNAAVGVRLLRHPTNVGMVANWNACLSAATRDWICIIHDDDSLAPNAIAALRRACALAAGPALIAHRSPAPEDASEAPTFRCQYREPGRWAVLHSPQVPSGVALHRSIVDALGGFDPRWQYSTDLEYFARIAARYPTVVIESPPIVQINYHGDNFQLHTWRRPDFLTQLEDIERMIITDYAGLSGPSAETLLNRRMSSYLAYMFVQARRWRSPEAVRLIARALQTRTGLGWRLRLLTTVAARTGWSPPPRTA